PPALFVLWEPPPYAPSRKAPRNAARKTFTNGESVGLHRASVTPPAPTGAERLPVLTTLDQGEAAEKHLADFEFLAGEPIQTACAFAVPAEKTGQEWQQGCQVGGKCPWRVEDDQPTTVEAGGVAQRRDRQLCTQNLGNIEALDAL